VTACYAVDENGKRVGVLLEISRSSRIFWPVELMTRRKQRSWNVGRTSASHESRQSGRSRKIERG
jgi:hypothetical protein